MLYQTYCEECGETRPERNATSLGVLKIYCPKHLSLAMKSKSPEPVNKLVRQIKFRVRRADTNEIVGYETLFPVEIDNTDYRWACSKNNKDWLPGMYYEDTILIREQYIGKRDRNNVEVFEGDTINVYDTNRGCYECDEIDEGRLTEHDPEGGGCENHLCWQVVAVKYGGYFCDEDTGDYCPPLHDDYIELELIK
jgi:hypothetical protein